MKSYQSINQTTEHLRDAIMYRNQLLNKYGCDPNNEELQDNYELITMLTRSIKKKVCDLLNDKEKNIIDEKIFNRYIKNIDKINDEIIYLELKEKIKTAQEQSQNKTAIN